MGKVKNFGQKQIEYIIVWELMNMDWEKQKKKISKFKKQMFDHTNKYLEVIEQNINKQRNTDWDELANNRVKEKEKLKKFKMKFQNYLPDKEPFVIDYLLEQLEKIYEKKKFQEVKKDYDDFIKNFELKSEKDLQVIKGFANKAEQKLYQKENKVDFLNILDEIIEREENEESKDMSISTGIKSLDQVLYSNGIDTSALTILAARPSMGKSTLAYNLYYRQRLMGKQAYFISLEGTTKQHIMPVMASIACDMNDNFPDWKREDFSQTLIGSRIGNTKGKKYKENYTKVLKHLNNININDGIIDTTNMVGFKNNINNLFDVIRGLDDDTEIVFVDHLHEYDVSENSYSSKERLDRLITGLRDLSQQKEFAIVLLAQLNRNSVDSSKNNEKEIVRRPKMSDISSSGKIEQIADNIFMLYRETYQLSEKEMKKNDINEVKLEVLIRKQKNGSPSTVELSFDMEKGVIRGYSIDDELASVPDLSQENQETEKLKLEGFSLDDLTNETEEELKESNPKFDSVKNVLEKDKAEVK